MCNQGGMGISCQKKKKGGMGITVVKALVMMDCSSEQLVKGKLVRIEFLMVCN